MISQRPITDPGPSDKDRWKWKTFNGPQLDPTRAHKKHGTPYYARRSVTAAGGRVLTPHDMMPIGPHAGKHLHAVPADYLLWVNQQPWSRDWHLWQPVAQFIENYITSDAETSQTIPVPTGPLIYVDPVQVWPTQIQCFKNGSSHLHTLPGYLDYLHTFAIGALRLNPDWFQHKETPHFDLTIAKHQQAIRLGAVEISRQQMVEHMRLWRQFRDSQPRPADDPSTHTRLPHRLL